MYDTPAATHDTTAAMHDTTAALYDTTATMLAVTLICWQVTPAFHNTTVALHDTTDALHDTTAIFTRLPSMNLDRSVRRDRADRRATISERRRNAPADHALQCDREINAHSAIHRSRLEPRRVAVGNVEVHGA